MISRASDNAVTSISVALENISGYIPHVAIPIVISAEGMIRPIRGIDIRFVRIKLIGNVPKYTQTRGAVVS